MTHFISPKALIPIVLISPVLLLPSLIHAEPAWAVDCVSKACIDVYTQNGQIIIEGRKGAVVKPRPIPKATPAAKPKPKPKPRPKPTATKKPVIKTSTRPVWRKRVVHKVVRKIVPKIAAGVSLNDRLVKMLPLASIARQPSANAIVNVPVIYWCNLPEVFMAKVAIVGEVIDVTMRPSFLWSFGDGSFFITTKAGTAYPHQVISHTYHKAGTYLVTMLATWGGTWTHNGIARAITGKVRKLSIVNVGVANGPTRITQ
jgi:hypothetical protein